MCCGAVSGILWPKSYFTCWWSHCFRAELSRSFGAEPSVIFSAFCCSRCLIGWQGHHTWFLFGTWFMLDWYVPFSINLPHVCGFILFACARKVSVNAGGTWWCCGYHKEKVVLSDRCFSCTAQLHDCAFSVGFRNGWPKFMARLLVVWVVSLLLAPSYYAFQPSPLFKLWEPESVPESQTESDVLVFLNSIFVLCGFWDHDRGLDQYLLVSFWWAKAKKTRARYWCSGFYWAWSLGV